MTARASLLLAQARLMEEIEEVDLEVKQRLTEDIGVYGGRQSTSV